jgi:hypothetical protein
VASEVGEHALEHGPLHACRMRTDRGDQAPSSPYISFPASHARGARPCRTTTSRAPGKRSCEADGRPRVDAEHDRSRGVAVPSAATRTEWPAPTNRSRGAWIDDGEQRHEPAGGSPRTGIRSAPPSRPGDRPSRGAASAAPPARRSCRAPRGCRALRRRPHEVNVPSGGSRR